MLELPDKSRIPVHVAVIMDGNGRWAASRGLPRIAGHREGVKSAREIVRTAGELGIKHLTLYTFSTENFRRSRVEVDSLMMLLVTTIGREVRNLMENNVRLTVIGRTEKLPEATRRALRTAEAKLAQNTGLHLILAIAYGSRQEIVDAVNRLRETPGDVDEQAISAALYTGGIPDPDLVIRTSGELRLSNFLLWQSAYAELVVASTYWPDFKRAEFIDALTEYAGRDRRFGSRSEGAKA